MVYKGVNKDEILLAGISAQSLVNGPGLRKVYFSQGCTHHCYKCFNPETWPATGGKKFKIKDLCEDLKNDADYLDGITFSGGDPIEQYDKFLPIALFAKKLKLNLWLWTGYTWEQLIEKATKDANLLKFIKLLDVVADGRFIYKLKSDKCKYRGSSNQRLIDVKNTFKKNKIIEYKI